VNAQAQAALEPAALPAFFSTYHAVVSLSVIVVQTMLARSALDTLGIGLLMGSSSLVMAAGSLVALAVPGLMAVTATYGLNSVVHQSLFRQAYEQFFTSVPSSEQRTFKPIADSFFNRLGAAGGAGLIALLTLLAPARVYPGLLVAAVLCAAGAVLLAGPMNRICISTLERGLLRRALELDLDERRGHLDADRRTPPALQRRGGAQPR
jgi:ATP/ADP translocase